MWRLKQDHEWDSYEDKVHSWIKRKLDALGWDTSGECYTKEDISYLNMSEEEIPFQEPAILQNPDWVNTLTGTIILAKELPMPRFNNNMPRLFQKVWIDRLNLWVNVQYFHDGTVLSVDSIK